jgi:hypothetical protein
MKNRYLAAFLAAITVAGLAWAGGTSELYNGLTAAPSELVTNGSGDSLTIGTTPLAGRSLAVKSNPVCFARVDFSGAAADTVILYCNLWFKKGSTWTYLGSHQATVTAGAVVDATGDNVGTGVAFFDTSAANYVELRIAAPSAGTADVTAWVGANDSQGQ